MKKRKIPFVIIFIALFVTAVAAMFYIGVSREINIIRALGNTQSELEKRLYDSPLALLTELPEYAQLDASLAYGLFNFTVQLFVNDEIAAVGGGLFGDTLYGVRHDYGASLTSLTADLAAAKPEYLDTDDSGVQIVNYNFTSAEYGEVWASLAVTQRRITRIRLLADGFDATLEFGVDYADDWRATINGTTIVWRSETTNGHALETFIINSERTVTLDWDIYSGGLTLEIDDLLAHGSLVIGKEDFHLQFNGDDAFALTFNGTRGDAPNLTAYEFVDVRDNLESLGDTFWFALKDLYERR